MKQLRKQLECDFGVSLVNEKEMIEAIVRTYIDPLHRLAARKAEPETIPKFGLFNYYQFGVLPEEASIISPQMTQSAAISRAPTARPTSTIPRNTNKT